MTIPCSGKWLLPFVFFKILRNQETSWVGKSPLLVIIYYDKQQIDKKNDHTFNTMQNNLECPEVGIYKRKQESKKTRKQELDQESDKENKEKRKKTRSRPRKKNFFSWSLSWSSSCFLNFLLSYFLVFFYKFPTQHSYDACTHIITISFMKMKPLPLLRGCYPRGLAGRLARPCPRIRPAGQAEARPGQHRRWCC